MSGKKTHRHKFWNVNLEKTLYDIDFDQISYRPTWLKFWIVVAISRHIFRMSRHTPVIYLLTLPPPLSASAG